MRQHGLALFVRPHNAVPEPKLSHSCHFAYPSAIPHRTTPFLYLRPNNVRQGCVHINLYHRHIYTHHPACIARTLSLSSTRAVLIKIILGHRALYVCVEREFCTKRVCATYIYIYKHTPIETTLHDDEPLTFVACASPDELQFT